MAEIFKPLDKETLDRLCREWDKRSGQGKPFRLIALSWPKPDGTQGDAIHIEENGQPTDVILDSQMSSDLT